MNKRLLYLSVFFILNLILIQCTKVEPIPPLVEEPFECELPPNVPFERFGFGIVDKNDVQRTLVGGVFPRYHSDSIRFYNDNGDVNNTFKVNSTVLSFKMINFPADSIAYRQFVSKKFYLVLNESDTDTVAVKFRLKYIKMCNVTQFDTISVFFNGQLKYLRNSVSGYPYLSFLK